MAHPRQLLGLAALLWIVALLLLAAGHAGGATPDTAHSVADGVRELAPLLPPPWDGLLTIFAAIASSIVAIFSRKHASRIKALENGGAPRQKAPRP